MIVLAFTKPTIMTEVHKYDPKVENFFASTLCLSPQVIPTIEWIKHINTNRIEK